MSLFVKAKKFTPLKKSVMVPEKPKVKAKGKSPVDDLEKDEMGYPDYSYYGRNKKKLMENSHQITRHGKGGKWHVSQDGDISYDKPATGFTPKPVVDPEGKPVKPFDDSNGFMKTFADAAKRARVKVPLYVLSKMAEAAHEASERSKGDHRSLSEKGVNGDNEKAAKQKVFTEPFLAAMKVGEEYLPGPTLRPLMERAAGDFRDGVSHHLSDGTHSPIGMTLGAVARHHVTSEERRDGKETKDVLTDDKDKAYHDALTKYTQQVKGSSGPSSGSKKWSNDINEHVNNLKETGKHHAADVKKMRQRTNEEDAKVPVAEKEERAKNGASRVEAEHDAKQPPLSDDELQKLGEVIMELHINPDRFAEIRGLPEGTRSGKHHIVQGLATEHEGESSKVENERQSAETVLARALVRGLQHRANGHITNGIQQGGSKAWHILAHGNTLKDRHQMARAVVDGAHNEPENSIAAYLGLDSMRVARQITNSLPDPETYAKELMAAGMVPKEIKGGPDKIAEKKKNEGKGTGDAAKPGSSSPGVLIVKSKNSGSPKLFLGFSNSQSKEKIDLPIRVNSSYPELLQKSLVSAATSLKALHPQVIKKEASPQALQPHIKSLSTEVATTNPPTEDSSHYSPKLFNGSKSILTKEQKTEARQHVRAVAALIHARKMDSWNKGESNIEPPDINEALGIKNEDIPDWLHPDGANYKTYTETKEQANREHKEREENKKQQFSSLNRAGQIRLQRDNEGKEHLRQLMQLRASAHRPYVDKLMGKKRGRPMSTLPINHEDYEKAEEESRDKYRDYFSKNNIPVDDSGNPLGSEYRRRLFGDNEVDGEQNEDGKTGINESDPAYQELMEVRRKHHAAMADPSKPWGELDSDGLMNYDSRPQGKDSPYWKAERAAKQEQAPIIEKYGLEDKKHIYHPALASDNGTERNAIRKFFQNDSAIKKADEEKRGTEDAGINEEDEMPLEDDSSPNNPSPNNPSPEDEKEIEDKKSEERDESDDISGESGIPEDEDSTYTGYDKWGNPVIKKAKTSFTGPERVLPDEEKYFQYASPDISNREADVNEALNAFKNKPATRSEKLVKMLRNFPKVPRGKTGEQHGDWNDAEDVGRYRENREKLEQAASDNYADNPDISPELHEYAKRIMNPKTQKDWELQQQALHGNHMRTGALPSRLVTWMDKDAKHKHSLSNFMATMSPGTREAWKKTQEHINVMNDRMKNKLITPQEVAMHYIWGKLTQNETPFNTEKAFIGLQHDKTFLNYLNKSINGTMTQEDKQELQHYFINMKQKSSLSDDENAKRHDILVRMGMTPKIKRENGKDVLYKEGDKDVVEGKRKIGDKKIEGDASDLASLLYNWGQREHHPHLGEKTQDDKGKSIQAKNNWERLHDWHNSDMSGRELRRNFWEHGMGGDGINNKIVSLTSNMLGKRDVGVIDTIHAHHLHPQMWNQLKRKYGPKYAKSAYHTAITGAYDGVEGLAAYESMEDMMKKAANKHYDSLSSDEQKEIPMADRDDVAGFNNGIWLHHDKRQTNHSALHPTTELAQRGLFQDTNAPVGQYPTAGDYAQKQQYNATEEGREGYKDNKFERGEKSAEEIEREFSRLHLPSPSGNEPHQSLESIGGNDGLEDVRRFAHENHGVGINVNHTAQGTHLSMIGENHTPQQRREAAKSIADYVQSKMGGKYEHGLHFLVNGAKEEKDRSEGKPVDYDTKAKTGLNFNIDNKIDPAMFKQIESEIQKIHPGAHVHLLPNGNLRVLGDEDDSHEDSLHGKFGEEANPEEKVNQITNMLEDKGVGLYMAHPDKETGEKSHVQRIYWRGYHHDQKDNHGNKEQIIKSQGVYDRKWKEVYGSRLLARGRDNRNTFSSKKTGGWSRYKYEFMGKEIDSLWQ